MMLVKDPRQNERAIVFVKARALIELPGALFSSLEVVGQYRYNPDENGGLDAAILHLNGPRQAPEGVCPALGLVRIATRRPEAGVVVIASDDASLAMAARQLRLQGRRVIWLPLPLAQQGQRPSWSPDSDGPPAWDGRGQIWNDWESGTGVCDPATPCLC